MATFYGSSSGQTTGITKLYGGAPDPNDFYYAGTKRSGGAGNVYRFYPNTFKEKMLSDFATVWNTKTLEYLTLTYSGGEYELYAHATDNTDTRLVTTTIATILQSYGVVANAYSPAVEGTDYIDLTKTIPVNARRITKLYGSVNGVTKRII